MWHCPHCGAPQAETARCWVCRKSSTTCSTCRHFRRSLTADVGWCARDPKRLPLTGLEMRGCWEQPLAPNDARPAVGRDAPDHRPAPTLLSGSDEEAWVTPGRDFVPVELVASIVVPSPEPAPRPEPGAEPSTGASIPALAADAGPSWAERTSLFGDLEA